MDPKYFKLKDNDMPTSCLNISFCTFGTGYGREHVGISFYFNLNSSDLGDKPNPEDWADLIDEDDDFREEFQKKHSMTPVYQKLTTIHQKSAMILT